MALKQNIIYIYFKGKHLVTSKSQYQYNHGQFLYFADLDLPQAFEVHFSNKDKGYSKPQVGSNKLVEIPDEYYWSGAQMIYAWIYLHSDIDDGETVYEVRIPLIKRAEPTDEQPLPQQESAMERAIAELNTAVEITTENANKTGEDRAQVSDIRDEVVDLKEDIDATAETVGQKAQDAIDASRRSEESAQNAAEFEEGARRYSEDAKQYAQEALESKNTAKQKADVATDASAEALGYRNEALEAKNQAVQAKQNIVDYRNETKEYRDETLNLKNNVQTLKNQIDETAEEIEETASTVRDDAESANRSASSANESASQASQSANGANESKNQANTYKNEAKEYRDQAEDFKNQSEANVTHYPKIIDDYWYVWDATNEEYINTNVDANGIKGDTGNGIESITLNDDYTLTIAFTDGTSHTTSSIRGEKGDTGESGVYIGTDEPTNENIHVWIDTDDDGTSEDLVADIADLQETNKKILNTYPTKTVSGAIATFDDGVEGLPLKNLNVDINPIQNLNGYESPWIGGAGKNLLNLNRSTIVDSGSHPRLEPKEFNEDQIWIGLSFNDYFIPSRVSKYNIAEDTVSLTITSSGYGIGFPIKCEAETSYAISQLVVSDENICFGIGFYDETGTYISSQSQAVSKVFTTPSTCEWLVVVFAPKNAQVETTYTKPQLEKGSTITDYAPYKNICHISGWTGMQLQKTGANILNPSANPIWDRSNIYTLNQDGSVTQSSSDGRGWTSNTFTGLFLKKGQYTLSFTAPNITCNLRTSIDDYTENYRTTNSVLSFTLTEDCTVKWKTSVSSYPVTYAVQLEVGTEATAYKPYQGQTIPINWQTEAGTVYGGSLNVVTGKLNVNCFYDYWDENISFRAFNLSNGLALCRVTSSALKKYSVLASKLISSAFKYKSSSSTAGIGNLYSNGGSDTVMIYTMILDGSIYDTAEKCKQWFAENPVTVVIPVEKPIEYQLTPQQINSLLGVNNIFADTGDSTVEYIYDPMKYIDDQINVDDVQINGESIVVDGVANIPIVSTSQLGLVKSNQTYGIGFTPFGEPYTIMAGAADVKSGNDSVKSIVPNNQHRSVFYGLAKVSGTDEKDSELPVGQYTDEAKISIKNMLGVDDVKKDDVYDTYVTDTATGTISSFEDGANDIPLKSLVVDINPIQDLHGQSNPYPAGGGVNQWDEEWEVGIFNANGEPSIATDRIRSKNFCSCVPNTEYYFVIPNKNMRIYFYNENREFLDYYGFWDASRIFTTPANAYFFKILGSAAYGTTYNHDISINYPSTDHDYHPYENLCPISGWTSVDVEQSGVNVWDEEWEVGDISQSTGQNEPASTVIRSKNYIPIKPNTEYFFNLTNGGISYVARSRYYDKNKAYIGAGTTVRYNSVFVTPVNAYYMRFTPQASYGTTYNHDISINYPSADHDYHPYTGRSITINLGQTVYGAKLYPLEGKALINMAMVDLGTLNYGYSNTEYPFFSADLPIKRIANWNETVNAISSMYYAVSGNAFPYTTIGKDLTMAGTPNESKIRIRNLAYTVPSDFKSAMSGVQLCYELATPITIQLTPTEVRTLLGQNNIFADTGDTACEYRADTKLYINKKITEAISALT